VKYYLWLAGTFIFLATWFVGSVAFGVDPSPSPTPFENVGDAIKEISDAVVGTKDGSLAGWLLLAATIVKGFWYVTETLIPSWYKKATDYGVQINVVASSLISLLYLASGGAEWWQVLAVAVSGPLLGVIHDVTENNRQQKRKARAEANAASNGQ